MHVKFPPHTVETVKALFAYMLLHLVYSAKVFFLLVVYVEILKVSCWLVNLFSFYTNTKKDSITLNDVCLFCITLRVLHSFTLNKLENMAHIHYIYIQIIPPKCCTRSCSYFLSVVLPTHNCLL